MASPLVNIPILSGFARFNGILVKISGLTILNPNISNETALTFNGASVKYPAIEWRGFTSADGEVCPALTDYVARGRDGEFQRKSECPDCNGKPNCRWGKTH